MKQIKISGKCFSHVPLGPGNRSCDLWQAVVSVALVINDLFPPTPRILSWYFVYFYWCAICVVFRNFSCPVHCFVGFVVKVGLHDQWCVRNASYFSVKNDELR